MRAAEEKNITADLAAEITGLPPAKLIEEIVFSSLATGEAAAGLEALAVAADKNIDPARLFSRVIQTTRQILLTRFAPELTKNIQEEVGQNLYEQITDEAKKTDSRINAKALHTLLAHHNKLSADTLGNLPLELAIISLSEKEG